MDTIKHGAAMTKPSDNEKEGKCNHDDGCDLSPKAARKLVFDWRFFSGVAPFRTGTFGRFTFFGSHKVIIAHFIFWRECDKMKER